MHDPQINTRLSKILLVKPTIKLPPGPYPYPIIGNILELSHKPYGSLYKLSKTYGPIMTLKFGSLTTIVISSPEIAKEALTKHNLAFPNKKVLDMTRALDHVSMPLWCGHASVIIREH
ncbi:hypothetical protein HN51_048707 [Arachis hypogaea]